MTTRRQLFLEGDRIVDADGLMAEAAREIDSTTERLPLFH
jgi:hypothetical protein